MRTPAAASLVTARHGTLGEGLVRLSLIAIVVAGLFGWVTFEAAVLLLLGSIALDLDWIRRSFDG